MKVTIMPNLTRENAYEITLRLCAALDKLEIKYDFYGKFSEYDVDLLSNEKIDSETDIIIAIGGDGTMIRAAKSALPYNIPVLGINAGKLAYLMSLEDDEMILLGKLLTGEYYTEARPVLEISVFDECNNVIFTDFCINDAVFARGAEIRLASFDFYCDERFVNSYKADGLIIATPTGSTAYNLSAGGPIVDPRVEGIMLTPICPHSLVERSVLFSSSSVLKIVNPAENILLSCDGCDSIKFEKKYTAVIKKADKKISFIRLKDETFLDILNKKMKIK